MAYIVSMPSSIALLILACNIKTTFTVLNLSLCVLSVSVMQAGVCITLTDNAQRYSAPSFTSGSRAHAHASCLLSVYIEAIASYN